MLDREYAFTCAGARLTMTAQLSAVGLADAAQLLLGSALAAGPIHLLNVLLPTQQGWWDQ